MLKVHVILRFSGVTVGSLLRFPFFVRSTINSSFQDLILTFELILEFVFKLLSFRNSAISDRSFATFQSTWGGLFVVIRCTLCHLRCENLGYTLCDCPRRPFSDVTDQRVRVNKF